MKKIKLLCLLCALAMMLSLLAGCGGQAGSGSTASVPEATGSAQTDTPVTDEPQQETDEPKLPYPVAEEPTTITGWKVVYPPLINFQDNMSKNSVMKWYAEQTNITFDCQYISAVSQAESFAVMIASDDYADVISQVSNLYGGGLSKAIEDGVIMDLNGMMQENMPNFWKIIEDNGWQNRVVDDNGHIGALYGIQETAILSDGVVIRKDYLDELNLDIPKTYDDMYNVLTAFKTELGHPNSMYVNYMGNSINNFFSNGYGISTYYLPGDNYYPLYLDNSGKVHFTYMEEGFRDYLTMMNKWYDEDLIVKDFAADTPQVKVEFSVYSEKVYTGDIAVFSTGLNYFDTHIATLEKGDDAIVAISDVSKTEGEMLHNTKVELGVPRPWWSITSDCEYPELVLQFMDYFFSDEGAFIGTWGFEGEAFEYDENGQPVYTDLVTQHEAGTLAGYGMYCMSKDDPVRILIGRDVAGYSDISLSAGETWTANQDGSAWIPSSISFTTEESETFKYAWAEIATYFEESIPKFIMGEKDLQGDFDDFVKQLEQLGAQDVIDVYQAAYDRYLARG